MCLLAEAMVMDNKVKESFVLDTASAVCSYDAHYKDHPKYWCRGYFRDYCHIIAFTPNSTGRVALRDTGNQLIVTVSCLTREDAGWYWCGIQRDFARDDMDFTELVVSDSRGAYASDFWPVKGKGSTRGLLGGTPQWWLFIGKCPLKPVGTSSGPSKVVCSLLHSRVWWLLVVPGVSLDLGERWVPRPWGAPGTWGGPWGRQCESFVLLVRKGVEVGMESLCSVAGLAGLES